MFSYVPLIRPDAPSLLRQLAYQANSPLLGPGADPDGRHQVPSSTVKGTVFKDREVQVSCVVRKLYFKSITEPNPLPGFTRKASMLIFLLVESLDQWQLALLHWRDNDTLFHHSYIRGHSSTQSSCRTVMYSDMTS